MTIRPEADWVDYLADCRAPLPPLDVRTVPGRARNSRPWSVSTANVEPERPSGKTVNSCPSVANRSMNALCRTSPSGESRDAISGKSSG